MTAATLREAADSITARAAEMRAAFPDSSEPAFLEAVAAWLEECAEDYGKGYGTPDAHALATARAWLGEDA